MHADGPPSPNASALLHLCILYQAPALQPNNHHGSHGGAERRNTLRMPPCALPRAVRAGGSVGSRAFFSAREISNICLASCPCRVLLVPQMLTQRLLLLLLLEMVTMASVKRSCWDSASSSRC